MGWLLPLGLAPVAFVGLAVGIRYFNVVVPVTVAVAAMIFAVFESFYVGLWVGQLPWMKRPGAVWRALLWSAALWLLAVGMFAPLTANAYKSGLIDVTDHAAMASSEAGALAASWDFAVFYFWHLLDIIPALDITETLRWNEPLTYDGVELGAFLLVYRAAVLLPLIASLRGILATRRDATPSRRD